MSLDIRAKEKVGEQINDRLILPDDKDTAKHSRRADGTSFSYRNHYGEELDHLVSQLGLIEASSGDVSSDVA
jgi:hypothetical protein